MKYVRFKYKDSICYGILRDLEITIIDGSPISKHTKTTGERVDLNEVELLAPLIPNEIIGIGANFIADENSRPGVPQVLRYFLTSQSPRSLVQTKI